MPRNMKYGLVAAGLLAMLVAPALAQDNGDGDRVPVYTEPTYITVNPDQPLALYVRGVDKDVANVAVMVKTAEGWTQLTPCDNVEVTCKNVAVKSEGVEEGDIFYLGSE